MTNKAPPSDLAGAPAPPSPSSSLTNPTRIVTRSRGRACARSAQSVGFIVGPLLGSAFVRHIGALNLGLAALSLGLSLTLRVCFKGAGLQSEGRHTEV